MGAQCVLCRFLYSVEALYIYLALRHATVETLQPLQPLQPLQLYSSTPSTLYTPLQHPSGPSARQRAESGRKTSLGGTRVYERVWGLVVRHVGGHCSRESEISVQLRCSRVYCIIF
eukprot:450469-Prymnesium_polylepis.1